jgi:hypothetical protein
LRIQTYEAPAGGTYTVGFFCVSDGKSSHRVDIVGDEFFVIGNEPAPDGKIELKSQNILRTTAMEDGETYFGDWYKIGASKYPQSCVDEELEIYGK